MSKPSVVDIYSGGGGFALGAQLAGFHVSDSIEIDADLHSSFPLNFPETRAHGIDARALGAAFWKRERGSEKLAGLVGGPPCQGFSVIGKKVVGDVRNELVGVFFDQVSLLRPKFFVMENVKGILDDGAAQILKAAVERVSRQYTVLEPLVLKASDYGLPTSRTRVFVIGIDPNEMESVDPEAITQGITDATTVRDAISDLPVMRARVRQDGYDWGAYRARDESELSSYAALLRQPPPEGMGWARAKAALEEKKVSGNNGTAHAPDVVKRFRSVPQGRRDAKSRYPKLSPDGLCPTLRAGTGSDLGSFQAMRPIHPYKPRVITVREAARLQSFPDWFVFHPTIWHSFRMIGNSVPPLLAAHIMGVLKSKL